MVIVNIKIDPTADVQIKRMSVTINRLFSCFNLHVFESVMANSTFCSDEFKFCGVAEKNIELEFGFYQENQDDEFLFSKFDVQSPSIQPCFHEIKRLSEIQPVKNSPISFDILNKYGSGFNRLNGSKTIELRNVEKIDVKLSIEQIVGIAATKFIQTSYQAVDAVSNLRHPFDISFPGLSDEEIRDVELAECLLFCAEKVGFRKYEQARKLLNMCYQFASRTGNPVARLVYHFSEGLSEKIDRETGRSMAWKIDSRETNTLNFTGLSSIACHREMPFFQVGQFTGIQTIVENSSDAKKIHVIDLGLKHGVCWTLLMQALVRHQGNPVELLKITAVCTESSKQSVEVTGQRLMSFANNMNLPFSFKIVMVADMILLEKHLFELDEEDKDDEHKAAVFVYSSYTLNTMIHQPNRLESVMRVIERINPRLMVVNEVEANHNSPHFVTRFTEALFFCSAYFDCLEACMKRDDEHRLEAELRYFSMGIRNIVATEGEDRCVRHVKFDVWRKFFARVGMVAVELSMAAIYQAKLLVEKFECGSFCSLDLNEECLFIGWKGTPIQTVSVWKFQEK